MMANQYREEHRDTPLVGEEMEPKQQQYSRRSHHRTPKSQASAMVVTLCLTSLLWTCTAGQQEQPTLVFTQAEEQAIGQFVGSISTSTLITDRVGVDDRPQLRYNLLRIGYEHSELFEIGQVSGNLTFAGRVNREAVCPQAESLCELEFGVAVSGVDNFFSTILVKVIITDINDNSPRFPSPSSMNLEIVESASRTLSLVTATDADGSDPFGVITYSIQPPSDEFSVELSRNQVGIPQLSLVMKSPLDREEQESYTLNVVAKDGGTPPRTGDLTVNIRVLDVNDNQPEFTETFYTANFSENAGPGYEIIRVSARDRDDGNNGRVVYMLSSEQNGNTAEILQKVAVDNLTGAVTLRSPLVSGQYKIFVEAQDVGDPPKSNQAVITATVMDTDNNQPLLQVNPVKVGDLPLGWVSEGSKISTPVAVLDVQDPDSGSNGNVSCESQDPAFQLQQISQQPSRASYKLIVAKQLNREDKAVHSVTVVCSDHGSPSLNSSSVVEISVYDVNDNDPEFSQSRYSQNLVENNLPGDTVLVVKALDDDDGDNKRIEYRVANAGGNFSITPDTGVVKANRKFDREAKAVYQFSVLAVDFGSPRRTGVASVTVNIIDANDEAPKFSESSYRFHVFENRAAETVVGNVSATDADLNEGGLVVLELHPLREGDNVPFSIDSEGYISSLEMFDREEQDTYIFSVVAKDKGQRPMSSTAMVTVNVLDVNDNEPTFIFPSEQNFSALVNVPINREEIILQIDVYDMDIRQNGIITYIIMSTNASDLFRIDRFSGEIIANRALGASEVATYAITINATDQGEPALWQVRTLNLVVQAPASQTDGVIADQNVLIVACIVCFTVVVSGAVLVAMCILRRLDRQRKLQYATSCCPDNQTESDNGSTMGDGNHQYDMPPNIKDHGVIVDHPSHYHQRHDNYLHHYTPQQHHLQQQQHPQRKNTNSSSSNNSTFKADPPRDSSTAVSRGGGGGQFFPGSQRTQVAEPGVPRGPDDFHSTSSTETATGDSGHGSDEDMSLEHPSIHGMDPSKAPVCPPGDVFRSGPFRMSLGGSSSGSQAHSDRPGGAMVRNPAARGKANSVRFDPNVTDIYEMPKKSTSNPSIYRPNISSASSNSSIAPPRPPRSSSKKIMSQNFSPYNQITPQSSTQSLQPQNFLHNHQQPSQPNFASGSKQALLMTRLQPSKSAQQQQLLQQQQSQRPNLSSLSQSSLGENDESDLNTTTSGSYSVASDDDNVARLNSLADVKDLYV